MLILIGAKRDLSQLITVQPTVHMNFIHLKNIIWVNVMLHGLGFPTKQYNKINLFLNVFNG